MHSVEIFCCAMGKPYLRCGLRNYSYHPIENCLKFQEEWKREWPEKPLEVFKGNCMKHNVNF